MHFLDKNVKTKKAVKNEATLRSDPTQAAEYYGEEQRYNTAVFLFIGYLQAGKPRGLGQSPNSCQYASSGLPVQAAGLSSKKIVS